MTHAESEARQIPEALSESFEGHDKGRSHGGFRGLRPAESGRGLDYRPADRSGSSGHLAENAQGWQDLDPHFPGRGLYEKTPGNPNGKGEGKS